MRVLSLLLYGRLKRNDLLAREMEMEMYIGVEEIPNEFIPFLACL